MNLENLSKNKKLVLSLIFDAIGMITFVDIIWAPVSGYLMTKLYKGRKGKIGGVFSFIEEAIPGFDIIPTFTIMWFYTYVFQTKKEETMIEV
ncbi:hypothetical protein [Changchengzhania lutea]|uniref:hypothetical protein n=1 Tax=Changchengzhania lutea TaxID=2049305 RepID=UPI00115F4D63|nr:hypothetical protein [Changchengzhania lutea]